MLPGSFGIAQGSRSQYSLRSILFHEVADTESVFTKGLGVTVTRKQFEAALKFIVKHYTPVSLQDVLLESDSKSLPPRPVLLTFDDAYASVSKFAAPMCAELGVPAVFFVNGSCLDNQQLALENLICYVTNVQGLDTVNAAIQSVDGAGNLRLARCSKFFPVFCPLLLCKADWTSVLLWLRTGRHPRKRASRRSRSLSKRPATPRSGEFRI